MDAEHAHHGPAVSVAKRAATALKSAARSVAPEGRRKNEPEEHEWKPGDAPEQVLNWAVQALAKAGTLSIVGVYPPTQHQFPIGEAMNKNLTLRMGNCHHRKYIPHLLDRQDPDENRTDAESGRRLPGVRLPSSWMAESGAQAGRGMKRQPKMK